MLSECVNYYEEKHPKNPNCIYVVFVCCIYQVLLKEANLLQIGAPPEVVARLEEAYMSVGGSSSTTAIGEDPALDQFMEAYCEMLGKYEQELAKPFKEAMQFLSNIEYQFKALTVASSDPSGTCILVYFILKADSLPHIKIYITFSCLYWYQDMTCGCS